MKIHLDIHLKDQATDKKTVQNAKVLNVLSTLTPLSQSLKQCFDPVDAVRAVLNDTYAGMVTEGEFMGTYYIWIYDIEEQKWVRLCIDSAAFDVDFGSGEVVEVRIWEGAPYSVP